MPTDRPRPRGICIRSSRPLHRPSTLLASLGTALLVLAACGDGAADDESLADFFGIEDDQEQMIADAESQQREMEEAIASCMADEGFEYIPRDVDDFAAADDPRQDLSAEEFQEEYGYGISTVDHDAMAPDQDDDPNIAIQEEMDDAEREAYQRALHGEMTEIDPDADPDEVEDQPMEPGGCQGEAMQEVQGEQMEVMQELQPEFMDLEQRISSDPRLVEAQEAWQGCMREAGYGDYAEQSDIMTELFERLNELQSAAFEDLDESEIDPEEPPEPDIDEEALAELQEEELAIASAEAECTEQHLDDVQAEVRAEHEADFIDEHRDELERARDAS